VSASPWQLYAPLADFVLGNGFPPGTFHLKDFRWKEGSFFKLFESPEKYKLATIEPRAALPKKAIRSRGDSGEKDPEVYGALAQNIETARILIRDVTNEPTTADRYRPVFKGLPEKLCVVFRDPKGNRRRGAMRLPLSVRSLVLVGSTRGAGVSTADRADHREAAAVDECGRLRRSC
jgi:hypothetical protein